MRSRGRSDTYVIADSERWKAECWAEADLERRLEVGETQWLGEGTETGWWTYGMGLDVYSRDEGDGGGEARGETRRRRERTTGGI